MSFARLKPLYVSLYTSNISTAAGYTNATLDAVTEGTTYAAVHNQWDIPVVDKASSYLVAIERLELSLNAIPFYDSSYVELITIRSRDNVALTTTKAVTQNAYSMTDLFEKLSQLELTDPNNALIKFYLRLWLDKDGFINMSMTNGRTFQHIQIEFPRRLNWILGISTTVQVSPYTEAKSNFPRLDLGDDLDHIVFRTDLPTFSDTLQQVRVNVMTDLAVPSSYTNSVTYDTDNSMIDNAYSTNNRQKLIYTPSERRYLELIGDFPIQHITIEAFYVAPDHTFKRIVLPYGGIFEIKLGFYLKS